MLQKNELKIGFKKGNEMKFTMIVMLMGDKENQYLFL